MKPNLLRTPAGIEINSCTQMLGKNEDGFSCGTFYEIQQIFIDDGTDDICWVNNVRTYADPQNIYTLCNAKFLEPVGNHDYYIRIRDNDGIFSPFVVIISGESTIYVNATTGEFTKEGPAGKLLIPTSTVIDLANRNIIQPLPKWVDETTLRTATEFYSFEELVVPEKYDCAILEDDTRYFYNGSSWQKGRVRDLTSTEQELLELQNEIAQLKLNDSSQLIAIGTLNLAMSIQSAALETINNKAQIGTATAPDGSYISGITLNGNEIPTIITDVLPIPSLVNTVSWTQEQVDNNPLTQDVSKMVFFNCSDYTDSKIGNNCIINGYTESNGSVVVGKQVISVLMRNGSQLDIPEIWFRSCTSLSPGWTQWYKVCVVDSNSLLPPMNLNAIMSVLDSDKKTFYLNANNISSYMNLPPSANNINPVLEVTRANGIIYLNYRCGIFGGMLFLTSFNSSNPPGTLTWNEVTTTISVST